MNVHDFTDPGLGKANPYGVYDVAANDGWVSVGTDHDTAAFAVETIRRWLVQIGHNAYPGADRLLICADGGGSNGYRLRAWKTGLAALAQERLAWPSPSTIYRRAPANGTRSNADSSATSRRTGAADS